MPRQKQGGIECPQTPWVDWRSIWVKDSIRIVISNSDLRIFIIFSLGIHDTRKRGSCSKSVQRCEAYSKTIVDLRAMGG